MTLKELKNYIINLPTKFDDLNVVNGELIVVEGDKTLAFVSNSIITIYVDESTNEIQFLHQSEEDVKNLLTDKG